MRFLPLLVLLAGCATAASKCEDLCVRLVDDCAFTAWPSVESCRVGCMDDLYRRDDVDDVLGCYHAALDGPTEAVAEAKVTEALDAGYWAAEVEAGTFDRPARVQQVRADGRCDPFAVVQCRIDSAGDEAPSPLLRSYR